jgi:hypothetical protein
MYTYSADRLRHDVARLQAEAARRDEARKAAERAVEVISRQHSEAVARVGAHHEQELAVLHGRLSEREAHCGQLETILGACELELARLRTEHDRRSRIAAR